LSPQHTLRHPTIMADAAKIAAVVEQARKAFRTGKTRDISWRKTQIIAIRAMIDENEADIIAALKADLSVNDFWAQGIEIETARLEIADFLKNLDTWAAPRKTGSPLLSQPAASSIQTQPFGVVLSISPWNYPFSLCVTPMLAAIAAGNIVVAKPSEISVNTSALLMKLIPKYLGEAAFMVEGDAAVSTELLKHRYDFIHYTGSTVVGKIVYAAAAKYLTPVLLELGGKSPAIVSKKADMKRACQRIAWGKWTMNNGQTCISPDYVITTPDAVDEVIQGLKDAVTGFYGENHKECRDISRMISARHLQRVAVQLDDESITVELGGEVDEGNLYIAPTIVRAEKTSKIMEDEIFGPVLPVIVVDDLDAAIEHVNIGEKPLALYVFSEDQKELDNVIQSTSSGGACANDIVMHAGNPELRLAAWETAAWAATTASTASSRSRTSAACCRNTATTCRCASRPTQTPSSGGSARSGPSPARSRPLPRSPRSLPAARPSPTATSTFRG